MPGTRQKDGQKVARKEREKKTDESTEGEWMHETDDFFYGLDTLDLFHILQIQNTPEQTGGPEAWTLIFPVTV